MAIWEVKQVYRSEWRDQVVQMGPGMLVVPFGEEANLPSDARAKWRIAVMEPEAIEYVRNSSPETLVEFAPEPAPAEGGRSLEQPPHDRMVKSPKKKR